MKLWTIRSSVFSSVCVAVAMAAGVLMSGCGTEKADEGTAIPAQSATHGSGDDHGHAEGEDGHDHGEHADHGHGEHADHDHGTIVAAHNHGGWWCTEHGVPEEECALCDSSLIAGFKAKGDWCELHSRPDSQCFLCEASRADRFIARYEAKFGEKPPARPAEGE